MPCSSCRGSCVLDTVQLTLVLLGHDHAARRTPNQRVCERHSAVRHERAVPAYGSFLFRDDLKPSPTGTSPCSHGAEACLEDAMSMEATLMPSRAAVSKKKLLDHDDGSPLSQGPFRTQASGCPSAGSRKPAGEDTRLPGMTDGAATCLGYQSQGLTEA